MMDRNISDDQELEIIVRVKSKKDNAINNDSNILYSITESNIQTGCVIKNPQQIKSAIRNCLRTKKLLATAKQFMFEKLGELYGN